MQMSDKIQNDKVNDNQTESQSPVIESQPKVIKPKRKCSEKQLEALAKGRAKNPRFKPKIAV